uniref:DNA polymerase delta subunit 4 n=1 Tax=Lotharella globosa TaxID=91324 RepID=A0A6V3RNN7_9EUKA|mmetsp:Transcript_24919/g.48692  ORF Transcript_24919/g.48692 Transcript_24919/m.48692 type:complete len:142 (-) Transcript_24919:304-729(-)
MPPKRKVTRQGSLNFTVVKRRGSPPRLEKDIGIPTNKFEKDKKIDDIVKKPIVVKVKPEPKAKQKPKVSKKHREDVERRLKEFDMDATYGPCIGITRIKRWERANKFGLNPPMDIKDLLEMGQGEPNAAWDELLNKHIHKK